MRLARSMRVIAGLTAALAVAMAAPALGGVSHRAAACHPPRHTLAHHHGAFLWSARVQIGGRVKTFVYLCAPPQGRTYVVARGGRYLFPIALRLELAGHFVGFLLAVNDSPPRLIVFDLARGRPEFNAATPLDPCPCSTGIDFDYWLAPNGWIAETLVPGSSAEGIQQLVATHDARSYFTIDAGAEPVTLVGRTLRWSTVDGGASTVQLGPDLIPSATPEPLTACQALTGPDVAPVLGDTTTASSPGQCTYTSTFFPGRTLTVGLQTGLTPAEQSAAEATLTGSGWDDVTGRYGSFHEFLTSTTAGGVTHEELAGFAGGVEVSLDLASAPRFSDLDLAIFGDEAFDRLFGVPVQRSL